MLKRIMLATLSIGMLASVVLVGAWATGQGASPAAAVTWDTGAVLDPAQTITVVGQGSVSASPDIARVSIGVETSAETVSESVQDNTSQMEAILSALEELGIAPKDIQTTNYSIYVDRYPEPMPRIGDTEESVVKPQYRVSNMVTVTIRDLESVSDVLDGVIDAGANNIWGVNFELEDAQAMRDEARIKAVVDALTRADALAELNEVELGPVMSVSEVIGNNAIPVPMGIERAMGGGGGPISPGEVEDSYQVQVTYYIAR